METDSALDIVAFETALLLIKNLVMFTAHDVSKMLAGNQEHDAIFRRAVHKFYERGAMPRYTRTARSVGNTELWVYHSVGTDASEYKITA